MVTSYGYATALELDGASLASPANFTVTWWLPFDSFPAKVHWKTAVPNLVDAEVVVAVAAEPFRTGVAVPAWS